MGEKLAFTNLVDGINVFSLPALSPVGAIIEKLEPDQNFLTDLTFLDDKHVVSGGCRNVKLYNTDSLCIISTFSGQGITRE